jgi:hypothetical protein
MRWLFPVRLSGRIPAGGDTRSNILSPGRHPRPAHLGKAGCLPPRLPGRHGWSPAQKGQLTEPLTPTRGNPAPPAPQPTRSAPGQAASRTPTAPAMPAGLRPVLDPPARSQNPAAIRGQGADSGTPEIRPPRARNPSNERLRSPTDTGKAARRELFDAEHAGDGPAVAGRPPSSPADHAAPARFLISTMAVLYGSRAARPAGAARVTSQLDRARASELLLGFRRVGGHPGDCGYPTTAHPLMHAGGAPPALRLANPPTACTVGGSGCGPGKPPVRMRRGRCHAGADSARLAKRLMGAARCLISA